MAELGLSLAQGPASTALGERHAATPRLACAALAGAINRGELGTALACFSSGAVLLRPEGSLAQGEAAIAARLGELIARGVRIEIELRGVIVAEEIALAHERWQISYEGVPDPVSAQAAGPTLVLRQIGGEWKIAIAAPWGVPASAPLRAIWP